MTEDEVAAHLARISRKFPQSSTQSSKPTPPPAPHKAPPPAPKRYPARKPILHGWRYDSVLEANYARLLHHRVALQDLQFFLQQVPFRLPGHVTYRLDFLEVSTDGQLRYVDTKGYLERIGKTKIAQVREIYRIDVEILDKPAVNRALSAWQLGWESFKP